METTNELNDEITDPILSIPFELYQKLIAYVAACDTEITGFFDVAYDKDEKIFKISKIYDLITQVGGVSDIEITEEEVAKFNNELIKQGTEHLPKGWWHSHVDMSTFLSPTDDKMIEELKNDSYIIALVLNKAENISAVIQIFQPIELRLNLKLQITYLKESFLKKAEKEVKQKVSKPSEVSKPFGYFGKESFNQPYRVVISVLSKNREKALRTIEERFLHREWDEDFKEFVYTNREGTEIYKDSWKVLKPADTLALGADLKDDRLS